MKSRSDYLRQLREMLNKHFSIEDLKSLCVVLGVNYDDLPGPQGYKTHKVRELVAYLDRHNCIGELVAKGRPFNEDIVWPSPPKTTITEQSNLNHLVNLLGSIKALKHYENRTALLSHLPAEPARTITRDRNSHMVDLRAIVDTAASLGKIESGKPALEVVIDNALNYARGTRQRTKLREFKYIPISLLMPKGGPSHPIEPITAANGAAKGPTEPRYLQSRFVSQHESEQMDQDSPLALDGGPYILQVLVGPGQGDVLFPDELLPFDKEPELSLPVRVTSPDLKIELVGDDVIRLARQGNSTTAKFQVTPIAIGYTWLNVDIFYNGNLLQRQRVEVLVVERFKQEILASARPAQTRRTAYTIAQKLSQEALARWEKRMVHIAIERDFRPGQDGSYFFSFRSDNLDLGSHNSQQTDQSLAELIQAARSELAAAAGAFKLHPEPQEARPLFERWLPQLALQGRQLRGAIFPSAVLNKLAKSAFGTVLQISPIGPRATLPWGLVYDRALVWDLKPDNDAQRTFVTNPVCPAWMSGHDCIQKGCPHVDDNKIVCPSGFWGYRYIIEQIPAGLGESGAAGIDLPQLIENSAGTRFNMNVFADFTYCDQEIANYKSYEQAAQAAGAEPFTLALTQDRAAFDAEIKHALVSKQAPHLIYFYAHGGRDPKLGVYLRIGHKTTTDYITVELLEDLGLVEGALRYCPLVFLNACESGGYTPDDYASFIACFHAAGACGVVGAECSVWERTARAVAGGFFRRLFEGLPAGEALWQTSHALLANHNPMGLAYSLFASSLTRLEHPIVKTSGA